jgi:hypothetical protein
MRSRDLSPLLRHPSVYSFCLATNEVRRCATRHGTAGLCSARRKHHFVYCCIIAETCLDVTVLTRRKYATICLPASSIILVRLRTDFERRVTTFLCVTSCVYSANIVQIIRSCYVSNNKGEYVSRIVNALP